MIKIISNPSRYNTVGTLPLLKDRTHLLYCYFNYYSIYCSRFIMIDHFGNHKEFFDTQNKIFLCNASAIES